MGNFKITVPSTFVLSINNSNVAGKEFPVSSHYNQEKYSLVDVPNCISHPTSISKNWTPLGIEKRVFKNVRFTIRSL